MLPARLEQIADLSEQHLFLRWLRGWLGGRLFLLFEPVELSDQHEDRKSDDGSSWFRRYQNIVLLLAEVSGTICSTSQCSTTLPFSSKRKMSIPA